MDGLVSTGTKIPYTILKINFPNRKIFLIFFINIFFIVVDKGSRIFLIIADFAEEIFRPDDDQSI